MKPVLPEGAHTYGTQTFPADGNCGVCVTTREKARVEHRPEDGDPDRLLRVRPDEKAFMAAAVAPSAQMALDNAGIKAADLGAIKTHNPFAANDLVMAKVMGLDANGMNNFGSSLIFGHPQAHGGPSHDRGDRGAGGEGGGYLLFSGCAAGDTAASIVLKVG